ncbi:hypothetical protein VFPPC_14379 [Pochonia chlamydosporia 170]|uniref:F-box domain-containing protein n=1 Tax=Pochonia chlamydosporia 170 TaxID=1380566 RepID=A0A179FMH2_METCM|nr:hypothetical protein VFPPC_14379 [Pochonia chlamydosporia 170]OAQ66782.1 hypothetical protein VFPPC_14379 [Pochonia chlamydosporia 170]
MNEAPGAVLNTVELLEAILLDLDIHTLLVSAPRVCQRWNFVIKESLSLQQALFFQPNDVPLGNEKDHGQIQPKMQNPFLKDVFPAWFQHTNAFNEDGNSLGSSRTTIGNRQIMKGYMMFQDTKLYKMNMYAPDNPFLRPCASWRRMLISQPPCRTIVATSTKLAGNWYYPYTAHSKDGLRMMDLYGITLQHAAQHDTSSFVVVWPEGGDDGYVHMLGHLARASAGMDRKLDMSARLIWNCKPDLVVKLLWNRSWGGHHVDFNNNAFWIGCGVNELLPSIKDRQSSLYASKDIQFQSAIFTSK